MRGAIHLIPDPARLSESLALAERYGAYFEYNDFFNMRLVDDAERCRVRIALYKGLSRDRSRDTLHGAFLDIAVHSDDPQIRSLSEARVRQSLYIARELGIRGVVFHSGLIANYHSPTYDSAWLERNRLFWTETAADFPELEILMENMFDAEPGRMALLAEQMADVKSFGICLDIAHAKVFGGDETGWISRLAPYIRHIHINDNDGKDDLHDAVGEGVTDWAGVNRALEGLRSTPSVLVETKSTEKQRRSLEYMQANGIYPF